MDVCHECGGEYEIITQHWSKGSCEHQSFTDHQHEVITGLVLGDGSVTLREDMKFPNIQAFMTSKDYLNYLSQEVFPTLSGEIGIHLTAEQHADNLRSRGHSPNSGGDGCSTSYTWTISCHPEIKRYYKWYVSGVKTFPSKIELTPTTLKHYYVGDGSFHRKKRTARISLCNERENKNKIVRMFNKAGFENFSWGRYERQRREKDSAHIRFSQEGTKWFFRYIGDPLPGFAYKWPENRR